MTASRTQIDHIKKTTDLSAYIRSRGISLSKKGKDLAGLCPFHPDKNPSLIVTPSKNLWNCVSCGAGGDVFEFVMKLDGLDFPSAVEKVREYSGEFKSEDSFADTGVELDLSSDNITSEENEILMSVISHYSRTFKENVRAKNHLKDRGIGDPATIEKFQIGYCTEGLLKMIPGPNTNEGKHIRYVLQKYGILRDTGREHFRGCITFPILDEKGIFRGMYGRRIESGSRVRHLYSTGKNRGLYNPSAFSQEDLIICESIIDALTFHANGIKNVSCIYGVNGYTDAFHEKIRTSNIKRVYVALDSDDPGNTSAESIMDRLKVLNIDALRVVLPSQMDINEYALKMPPAEESLRSLVRNAKDFNKKQSVNIPDPFISSAENVTFDPYSKKDSENKKNPNETGHINGEPVISGEEVQVSYAERNYRVRGLFRNTSDHQMKINLKTSTGDFIYVDTIDFLSAKARSHYITNASIELSVSEDIIKTDLARLLDALERIQEKRISDREKAKEEVVEIPEERKQKALEYLKNPDLIKNIVKDFEISGLAGERINALVGYLGVVSRKTEAPLAIIIQSSSSAGKSTLMEAILNFVPEEDRIKYSFMTGQSLYYMQSRNLRYKIIAIAEEEGIERAKYAIKILQSEGKITIATTVKDSVTGMPDTKEFTVEGPVMFMLTTTNVEIDEEIQNRSLILTVNESREQTRLIQKLQRESQTLEGILRRKDKNHLSEIHSDCQRLLRSYEVINPYVPDLDFPDHNLRTRRDHMKFLTLIHSIVLLHQYQRERSMGKTISGDEVECLVATKEDVALAAFLAGEVFGISMDDLAPQTRQLLFFIDEYVKKESEEHEIEARKFRFTRRELREYIRWSDTRVRKHLDRLVEMEFVIPYGGGQGKLTEYELFNPSGITADNQSAVLFFLPETVKMPDEDLILFLKNGVSVEKKSKDNGSSHPFDPTSHPKTPTSSPLRTHFAPRGVRSDNPKNLAQTADLRQIDPTSPGNPESILREKNSSQIGAASMPVNGNIPGVIS